MELMFALDPGQHFPSLKGAITHRTFLITGFLHLKLRELFDQLFWETLAYKTDPLLELE
jgi:hypothetical protein